MASYTLSPIGGAGSQFFDNSGNVLSGGKLYTYLAGTTTPQATWTTPAGSTANPNPIILNAAGRPPQEIWLSVLYSYKFVIKDANDVLIATYDNIPGLPQPAIINDASGISYEQGNIVDAGSFVVGNTYMIATVGDTDFVAIGAAYNSIGQVFVATGAGSGTGTAYSSRTVQSKLQETISVTDFGAVGDGIVDDTAALQAAIDAAQTDGSQLFIPAGTYMHSGLTISDNITIHGADQSTTTLKLISGSDTNSLTINDGIIQNPIITDLTIDGNRAGNTAGHGIYLPTYSGSGYGFSVVLYNVYSINAAETCLYVGTNRNMGHAENSEFKRGARCVYIESSSDWRFIHGRFAFPLTTHAFELNNGADNVFVGCSFYGATLDTCVRVYTQGNSPTKFIGCTFNDNQKTALHFIGGNLASPTSGQDFTQPHIINGCWFADNSLETNGAYPHILYNKTKGASFVGNTFRYTGTGNRPSYLIEFLNANACIWEGQSYSPTAPYIPYETAVTNTSTKLEAKLGSINASGNLIVEGTASIGGVSGSESLHVQAGAANGNYVSVLGRAAGNPAEISAQGADTNINLRLISKGTGTVDAYANGLRVHRAIGAASAVNYVDIYNSVTGSPVQIGSNGTDTDVDLKLLTKGAGVISFGVHTGTSDTPISGYITIKDETGTTRKLAVIS